MKKLDDFISRQRRVSPPAGRAADMERAVMSRITQGLRAQPRIRLRAALAGGLVFACALTLIIVVSLSNREPVRPQPDFTESVVILDGHVCIWLEPCETPGKGVTRP